MRPPSPLGRQASSRAGLQREGRHLVHAHPRHRQRDLLFHCRYANTRDLLHQIGYPEQNASFYQLTNFDREGRYRLVKEIVVDPHAALLLMHTRLEALGTTLRGTLRLYARLAPHMIGTDKNNSA
jgi:hypothetical protein